MKYWADIFWSKNDDAFIAEVPELPGCAADGATKQASTTSGLFYENDVRFLRQF